jgi:hypothetical protein
VREALEEGLQCVPLAVVQDREAWQRPPAAAVERRRDAPHAAPAVAQLALLDFGELLEAIGRVGDDRVDRVARSHPEPSQRVTEQYLGALEYSPGKSGEWEAEARTGRGRDQATMIRQP